MYRDDAISERARCGKYKRAYLSLTVSVGYIFCYRVDHTEFFMNMEKIYQLFVGIINLMNVTMRT